MGSSVRINMAGVRAVLKSGGVKSLLGDQASAALSRCRSMHDGYASRVEDHSSVSVAQVFTASAEAAEDNLRNNTLKKGSGW